MLRFFPPSLCRAPPPLSSSSGTESLPEPPEDAAFSSLFCFFSISLLFLILLVDLKSRSLRLHFPTLSRLCLSQSSHANQRSLQLMVSLKMLRTALRGFAQRRSEVTVTSSSPPLFVLCRSAVFSIQTNILSLRKLGVSSSINRACHNGEFQKAL